VIGKLEIVADEAALADAATERFISDASSAVRERGIFTVSLAGGSTPKAMYGRLAAPPLRDRVDWNAIRFYFGDERCVPPDHTDSNYGMARQHLLTPLAIPDDHVYRIRAEAEPQVAADEYEDVLRRTLGAEPVLDLVFLGMGPEGHTASLFPGTFVQFDPCRLVVTTFVEKLHANRITLTPHAINGARAILVVAGGESKADALAHVLAGAREPDVYPAQILNPRHGTLTWLVDRAAAGGLAA
jgi:6-phosphogluconolactonase